MLSKMYRKFRAFGIRTKHDKYYKRLKHLGGAPIKVLDLGCGNGNSNLKINKNYYVVGIDISSYSLLKAKEIYDGVCKASASCISFSSNIFDCVCSFDLIGHIPSDQKDDVIKEIHRVLTPGGLSFHYIEVDSRKGYNNWAKGYPQEYKKHFIERDGHFGLEYYKDTLKRFTKHGFSLVEYKVLAKFIIPPGEISKRFDNEFKTRHALINIMARLDAFLSRYKMVKTMWAIILKPLEIIFEPLFPDDWGGLLFIVHKKK